MPIEINGKQYYTPAEVAKIKGTNVGMVRYHRNVGNIEGTEIGTSTLYTMEQIQAADFSRKKPGPKTNGKEASGRPGVSQISSTKSPVSNRNPHKHYSVSGENYTSFGPKSEGDEGEENMNPSVTSKGYKRASRAALAYAGAC